MALGCIVAVCCLSVASAASGRAFTSLGLVAGETALEDSWDRDSDASTKSPVKRVVELLQNMKAQLEAEGNTESSLYDKMVCWCKTNDEEKSKAIADADAASSDLESQIGVHAARHGTLATEIEATKQFIAQEKNSLAQASAIREKEASQLSEEETNTMQILTNLKNAIEILSKHHSGSLLQMDSPLFASIAAVVRDATLHYEFMVGDGPVVAKRALQSGASLLAVSKRNLASAIRNEMGTAATGGVMPVDIAASVLAKAVRASPGGAFVQADPSKPTSYSSRSSVIYGLLKQMKDEFESTLSQIQKDELSKRESFTALAASKGEQIDAAKKKLDSMEEEHADNQKALSDANENLALTREQRSADVEFLRNLKLQCQSLDKQWQDRSATRSEEIKAVTEAIAILTEDDARDLLHHSVSFVQEQSIKESASASAALRSRVAGLLRKAAANPLPGVESNDLLEAWNKRSAAWKLSTLAVSVELDSFAEVKIIMDKMVADLKVQQEEEVKSKDHCEAELKGNEKMTYVKNSVKADLESRLETLAAAITAVDSEIESANVQIAETQVQIKKAGEAREKENAAFQIVVTDQRATQNILQKALARLDAFYKSKASEVKQSSLLQRGAFARQTPPEQFNTYKNNAGSSSVMGLLEQIIEDSKRLENEAIAGETTAQASYEEFVKDSNKVISESEALVVAKTKSLADAKAESASTSSDHRSVVEELDSLAQYNNDLHIECDFLLKNFDIRQRARLAEIEAINQAKAYLSGQFQDF